MRRLSLTPSSQLLQSGNPPFQPRVHRQSRRRLLLAEGLGGSLRPPALDARRGLCVRKCKSALAQVVAYHATAARPATTGSEETLSFVTASQEGLKLAEQGAHLLWRFRLRGTSASQFTASGSDMSWFHNSDLGYLMISAQCSEPIIWPPVLMQPRNLPRLPQAPGEGNKRPVLQKWL